MSTFAIIPWSEEFTNDRMFDVNSSVNRDHLMEPYRDMQLEFERCGHMVHTIDYYKNYEEIDYFLFFTLDWGMYKKLVSQGRDASMVYCTAEPPSVHSWNDKKGYKLLRYIFPYILTWNGDWVDDRSIFRRNIPYFLVDQTEGNLPFTEKKLITFISGNKRSSYKGELYSERERAISFFEKYHPSEFEFYGTGWDENEHLCYKGKCANKAEVFHKYKFAICFENIEGLNGYITEKLLDCLESGIVPIYAGASNVDEIIPKECFIKYRDFSGFDNLYNYLMSVTQNDYDRYLAAAKEYINSSQARYFTGERYAHYIIDAVSHNKGFNSSYFVYKLFRWIYA